MSEGAVTNDESVSAENDESRSGTRGSVLVPTGRKMKSYACLRSLNRRGVRTIVASEYERIPHFSSKYCSERVHLSSPPSDLAAYTDDLLAVASRPDVETIVPVRECDVYAFAKYREAFESEVSLVTPPLETLRKGHDRLRLARAAEEAGVPYPETRLLSDVADWNSRAVIKSRYNILTDEYVDSVADGTVEEVRNVRFIRPGESPDPVAIREEMKHEPIVQEFVPQADKILYCALWDRGEPLATYQHRQIRQNSWVGGGGVYRRSTYSQAVEDVASDLLGQLDWHGFACIEYLKDEDTGEWKFLEINPRIWQSIPEAVRAGADFPYYYWLTVHDEAERIDPSYDMDVGCHIAYGEVAHLLSILRDESPFVERPSFGRTLFDIVASCISTPRFDYVRRDDPGLVLAAIREALSTGVTRSRQYSMGAGERRPTPTDGGKPEK